MSEIVDVIEAIVNPGLNVAETVYVYGPIFLALLLLYSLIRGRPSLTKLYNPRRFKSVAKFWVWGGLKVDEDATDEQAGLDALCLLRWIRLGVKVALVGSFCAVWLIPVYRTAVKQEGNLDIHDELTMWSMGNLHNNDPRLAAPVLASYVVFLFALALIYRDFGWYAERRHHWLSCARPESYTVYVGNLPPRLRSNTSLATFFRDLYGETVCDCKVAFHLGDLEREVAQRDEVLAKLEHANSVLQHRGKRPTKKAVLRGGGREDSIEAYNTALSGLNASISGAIRTLQDTHRAHEAEALAAERRTKREDDRQEGVGWSDRPGALMRSAAFVTFRSLASTQSALQLLHDRAPFSLVTQVAPRPGDVYWRNVGLSQARVNAGRLLSTVMTAALCLFWTVPVFFIAGLAKLESLKAEVAALRDAPEWLDNVLAQISPLTLIFLQTLLPHILMHFAKLEGHISEAALQTSLFLKLVSFQLIQIFYITALSGSILNQLQELLISPAPAIVDALGQNLPGQAPVFMSFVLVKTFLALMIELLRIVPAALAWVRGKIGPNLTPRESSKPYMGLSPLCCPTTLDHASLLSDVVLFFMIAFVYSALHPVASLIMLFAFSMKLVVYKNQLLHVYAKNDTGGLFWPLVAKVLIWCLVFAEITVIAVLSLKESPAAAILMAPLVFATVYFLYFVGQQHFRAAKYLPSCDCVRLDKERSASGFFYSTFADQYVQDALKKLEVWPDSMLDSHFFQKEDLKQAARSLLCPPTPPGHPMDMPLMWTPPCTPVSPITEAAALLGKGAWQPTPGKARHLEMAVDSLEEIARDDWEVGEMGGQTGLFADAAKGVAMRRGPGQPTQGAGVSGLDDSSQGRGVIGGGVRGADIWRTESAGLEASGTASGGEVQTVGGGAVFGAPCGSPASFEIVVPVAGVAVVVPVVTEASLQPTSSPGACPDEAAGAALGGVQSTDESAAPPRLSGPAAADFQVVVPISGFEISNPVSPKSSLLSPERTSAEVPSLIGPGPVVPIEADFELSSPVEAEASPRPERSRAEGPPPIEPMPELESPAAHGAAPYEPPQTLHTPERPETLKTPEKAPTSASDLKTPTRAAHAYRQKLHEPEAQRRAVKDRAQLSQK